MGNIVLLDDLTINKIAAGEVIERPASVVKEMLENSIDAGATKVNIEVQNGGIAKIRISDNGKGIEPDDMVIAFERHATSKIRRADDLDYIRTMGFRGEALASIAAIARVEMVSRTSNNEMGYKVVVEAGNVISEEMTACPVGTTITVEKLFFNTPVRYKFLKKDYTEAGYIEDTVKRIALVNPNLSIKLVTNGKTEIQTNGNGKLNDVIYTIYGKEIVEGILPIDYTYENIVIKGVIGKPEIARSNRTNQMFFINKRYVKDKTLSAAVEQAMKGMLPIGKFPFLVMNIEMDPAKVDVNVHPAKLEVRFVDESEIFKAVMHAVKSALLAGSLISNVSREKEADNAYQQHYQDRVSMQKLAEEVKKRELKPEIVNETTNNDTLQSAKNIVELFRKVSEEKEKEQAVLQKKDILDSVFGKLEGDEEENTNNSNNENNTQEINIVQENKAENATQQEKQILQDYTVESQQQENKIPQDYTVEPQQQENKIPQDFTIEQQEENQVSQGFNIEPQQQENNITEGLPRENEITNEINENLENNLNNEHRKVENTVKEDDTDYDQTNPYELVGLKKLQEDVLKEIEQMPVLIDKNEKNEIEEIKNRIFPDASENDEETEDEEPKKVENINEEKQNVNFEIMYEKTFGDVPASVKRQEIKFDNLQYVESDNLSMFTKNNKYKGYKYIGTVFSTYIIIEVEDEMYILDQHAAHERIMYEKVKENYYSSDKDCQIMLLPDVINLTNKEMYILRENSEIFDKAGFKVEEFGDKTVKLVGVPSSCMDMDTKTLFLDILDELDTVARTERQEAEEKFIATIACKAAVKANMHLEVPEVIELLDRLMELPNPFTCPHGRPTAIKMSKNDIERKFSRR